MNAWYGLVLSASAFPTLVTTDAITQAADPELPPDSYYQLDVTFETHTGKPFRLRELRGAPVIVAMFYASCPHVCPMTISTIKAIEAELAPGDRRQLRVLMITLDPERDTPALLAELANRHRVDGVRWQFARSAPRDVRLVAAVLGVQYRELPGGGFNHSAPMILLDGLGREVSRSDKLGVPAAVFLREVAAVRLVTER